MIDIKELRRLAQTVQSPAHNINERVGAIHKLHDTMPSGVVLELLDRLEAAESELLEEARLNGMGSEREAALIAKLEAAEKERDALRAKVAEMGKQEPVGTLHDDGCFVWRETAPHQSNYAGWKMALYALPGAQTQGEEK